MSTVVAPSPSADVHAQVSGTSVPVVADPQRQRLAGLDGVRGLAALAFSLAVAWLIIPQPGQGVPNLGSVLANGLLVQNFAPAHLPNAAFWSMAVEAQLYVALPLLLLMVRRWGAMTMVATVTLVVATVGVVGPLVSRLDTFVIHSPPDLAALFALGVLTAGIVGASTARRSWPWAWLALAAAAPVVATIWWQGSVWTIDHLFWVDLALGPAIACLPVGLATGQPAPLLRRLSSSWAFRRQQARAEGAPG